MRHPKYIRFPRRSECLSQESVNGQKIMSVLARACLNSGTSRNDELSVHCLFRDYFCVAATDFRRDSKYKGQPSYTRLSFVSSAIYRIRYGFGVFLRYGSRVLSNIKPVAHIGLASRGPRQLFHPYIGHQEH